MIAIITVAINVVIDRIVNLNAVVIIGPVILQLLSGMIVIVTVMVVDALIVIVFMFIVIGVVIALVIGI